MPRCHCGGKFPMPSHGGLYIAIAKDGKFNDMHVESLERFAGENLKRKTMAFPSVFWQTHL